MEHIIDRAASACGGATKLAALMGESPQAVSNWRKRGVPLNKCALLETVSGQAVRRWEMQPTDWHRIWPELIGTEGAPPAPMAEAAAEGA